MSGNSERAMVPGRAIHAAHYNKVRMQDAPALPDVNQAFLEMEHGMNREEREEHADDNPALSNIVERNIRTIIALHDKMDNERNSHDRIADAITSMSGRMIFVYFHIVIFTVWILINTRGIYGRTIDPSPFSLLNTIVTLEAIIITTLVLISQNRISIQAKQRADLDLQVGLLTEHELTRVLVMLDAIQERLGIGRNQDGALADLEMETKPEDVLSELERLQNRSQSKPTPPRES